MEIIKSHIIKYKVGLSTSYYKLHQLTEGIYMMETPSTDLHEISKKQFELYIVKDSFNRN